MRSTGDAGVRNKRQPAPRALGSRLSPRLLRSSQCPPVPWDRLQGAVTAKPAWAKQLRTSHLRGTDGIWEAESHLPDGRQRGAATAGRGCLGTRRSPRRRMGSPPSTLGCAQLSGPFASNPPAPILQDNPPLPAPLHLLAAPHLAGTDPSNPAA